MNDARPTVSVIIAAYHSARFLSRCLASIEAQTFRDFETILVNSSAEGETAAIVAGFPGVRFVQSPERLLPHAARNAGVALAQGSLLVFTDADCEADRGWLAALVAAHEAGHEIVGGCIDSKAVRMASAGIHLLKYAPYLGGAPAGPIPLAATGNLLVSRVVWGKAGPFDGSVFCGDALLSWRAREAGFVPWYEPRAIVVDQDEQYRQGFFAERYRRGREFGRVRADHERWGTLRRCLGFAGAPVAALLAVAKTGRACFRGGRTAAFLATLPFQCAAQLAWCAGEAIGFLDTTDGDPAGRTPPNMRTDRMTTPSLATPRAAWSSSGRIGLLAVLYLVCGHLSFLPLVQNVIVTPAVFYSEGIALAFALWYGGWVWSGIFLGQLALAVTRGLPWLPALGIAATNSLQACLAVWLFRRLGLDPRLERARDLAGLHLLIVCVLQPFSATLGHAALWLGGVIDTPIDLALSWRNWWLGDILGQMLVTPLLLSLFAGHRTRREAVGDVLFSMAVLTPVMAAGEVLWLWTGMISVVVLLAPAFIWIAIRRGLVGVCSGGLFVAAVAMFATGRGWGPFVVGGAASILDLDIFLIGMTIGKQFIAVFLHQLARQRETEEALRAEEENLKANAVAREKALEAEHRRDLETKLRTSLAAAAVAHEIAQPLSSILLQSNLALHKGEDARAALGVVAAETRRVVTTIDKMKTLLRSVQTEHHPVDLDQVVRSSLLYNAGMLERCGIAVREGGLGGGCRIRGDEAQLLLAINNLLRNAAQAIDAGADGRREIAIDLSACDGEVILAVGDSGPGWSGVAPGEALLATTKSDGTGLGLFVVHTVVENHAGRLVFGRSPLGGAEVTMVFPRAA